MAVLCANLIFGLNIPVSKALLTQWMTPFGYMAARTLVATIVFWVIQGFLPKEKVTPKDLAIIATGGIMEFVVSQSLTAVSLQYTSPVYFSLIVALSPLVVMLLAAIFLKEPITGKKMAGVVLGIAGALLMIVQIDNSASGKNSLWGIFLAVISVTAFSVYLIIIRSVAQKYTTVTQMKWMFLFAAIILVPLGCTEYSEQTLFSADMTFDPANDLRATFPRFTRENMQANMPLVTMLNGIAMRKGASSAQIALAWLLAQKPFIVPIPGMDKLEYLDDNIASTELTLTQEDLQEIEDGLSKIEIHGARLSQALLDDIHEDIK